MTRSFDIDYFNWAYLILLLICCLNLSEGFQARWSAKSQFLAQSRYHHNAGLIMSGDALSLPIDQLNSIIGGSGRGKLFWELLRQGQDPCDSTSIGTSSVLSEKARNKMAEYLQGNALLSTTVSVETLSSCGTRKFLQTLGDGQSIESVLIPATKYGRTTLCVSTQIGCDRGCQFCLTSKMGLIRNLTSDEIISQVVRGIHISRRENMPQLTNIVFMGMGDAGRNVDAVGVAVDCLVDRNRLSMAQSKVTVSTVGPSPEIFMKIAQMPATIAWSLHSADDEIRRKLVPSTKHSVVELRTGLLQALETRSVVRSRTIMIAVTLIDHVNDSLEDAKKIAEFIRPMLLVAPKIVIDLIPYNDISVLGFVKPSREKVNSFQSYLRGEGFFCSVRLTRGDDESSACGMLATKRMPKNTSATVTVSN